MHALERLDPHESALTLGVQMPIDGSDTDELIYLRKKSVEFADRVRTGNLQRNDAWIGMRTTILKTFDYAMPAICLTEKECKYFQ